MTLELQINGSLLEGARYVGWAPSPCLLRSIDAPSLPSSVVITNRAHASGGKLLFYEQPTAPPRERLELSPAPLTRSLRFWVGGKFGSPSSEDGDTAIVVGDGTRTLFEVPVMVRVRKDANTLSSAERDRFLEALARLNDAGAGVFQVFREMHVGRATEEAHGRPGFLPWHRAYLLDLERELQLLDPSVTLPYWRFDVAAERLFHPAFLGGATPQGLVRFAPGNPLRFWVTDGVPGIHRLPEFDTAAGPAQDADSPGPIPSELETLSLGQAEGSPYLAFWENMEMSPHGYAHVSFGGSISSIGTAARDPLFFLLHANVDRLWAKWQWLFRRFDVTEASTYGPGGRVGHELDDSMWPWNGISGGLRPPTAPGGELATSLTASAPTATPRVREMFDYQGRLHAESRLGFDYDDVPFD
jgi:tyrosinase